MQEEKQNTGKKKTRNPYAFPQTEFNDNTHPDFNGMTLRDFFSNSAMQAHLASEYGAGINCDKENMESLAKSFYYMADAMLKQREIETL